MNKQSLIQRMENKFGRYAIKNLIVYILIGYVIGYLLVVIKPEWYTYLILDASQVMHGQIWRLFTWICTIPTGLSIFVIFVFLFYYFIGKSLERTLGAFKYNLFMFSGWLFMTLGAMIVYWVTTGIYGDGAGMVLPVSTYYLNLTSFLAFALLFPDTQVLLFFIIPIKMKWLAYFDVAYLIYQIVLYAIDIGNINSNVANGLIAAENVYYYTCAYWAQIFSIIISLLNFVIFFFMVRKISPGNMKKKFKDRKDQKKRQEEWKQNWQYDGEQWRANRNPSNDKSGMNRENNGEFMGWADWYDPDEAPEEREAAQRKYYEDKEKERLKKQREKEERTEAKRRSRTSVYGTQVYEHKCELCGRTNITNPELVFRFCSRCDGNHEYCEDHIFTHEHIKE